MLKWLRTNPKAGEILSDIQDIYTEALMCDMLTLDKHQIIEHLADDDVYILLEEINRWRNRSVFDNSFQKAIKAAHTPEILSLIEGGFPAIDNNFKKYKSSIITFLSYMYPAEKISQLSDVNLIEYMQEVSNVYKKYKP